MRKNTTKPLKVDHLLDDDALFLLDEYATVKCTEPKAQAALDWLACAVVDRMVRCRRLLHRVQEGAH